MLKYFKYRIYPTTSQCVLIKKHIDADRFIYNIALETKIFAWSSNRVSISCFELMKQLPALKNECPWLKELNSQSLQASIRNLENAFTQFFKGNNDFPKFKKKSNSGNFNAPQQVFVNGDKLIVPKFRSGIKITLHRPLIGEIRQATISVTSTGKYFASILCETGEVAKNKNEVLEGTTIGLDLGIKSFLTTSDGIEYSNPKFLDKIQGRLGFIQRRYSKYKGRKSRRKLATLHEKAANQRRDYLNKVSSDIVNNHDSIAIENLDIPRMLKSRAFSSAIHDAGWGMFIGMLRYKSDWKGVNLIKIGRFEPSSKIHNKCGFYNKELSINDRIWVCKNCGESVHRDVNAAINIKKFAIRNHLSVGCRLKNQEELPTLVGVMTLEANMC